MGQDGPGGPSPPTRTSPSPHSLFAPVAEEGVYLPPPHTSGFATVPRPPLTTRPSAVLHGPPPAPLAPTTTSWPTALTPVHHRPPPHHHQRSYAPPGEKEALSPHRRRACPLPGGHRRATETRGSIMQTDTTRVWIYRERSRATPHRLTLDGPVGKVGETEPRGPLLPRSSYIHSPAVCMPLFSGYFPPSKASPMPVFWGH